MLSGTKEFSDVDLIGQVRAGSSDAYHQLYVRHLTKARNLAWYLTRSAAEADDVVAEAFARVLGALRAQGGPTLSFGAYLHTTLRNVAYERARTQSKVALHWDTPEIVETPDDPITRSEEGRRLAEVLDELPERWRTVLRQTLIEDISVAEIAKTMGMTANGVAALLYRAKQGLRRAYWQAHLDEAEAA